MDRDEMRRIVEAGDRVWLGWWPVLRGLAPDLATHPLIGSYPDMRTTVAHMVWSEAAWQPSLEQGPEHPDPPSHGDLAQVEAAWREVRARRTRWLERADPDGDVRFHAADGTIATIRAWECVIHMVSHAHFHRGQLVMQMRQLGLVPPSHHLIGRFMEG